LLLQFNFFLRVELWPRTSVESCSRSLGRMFMTFFSAAAGSQQYNVPLNS
jgi:hypothetical protein